MATKVPSSPHLPFLQGRFGAGKVKKVSDGTGTVRVGSKVNKLNRYCILDNFNIFVGRVAL